LNARNPESYPKLQPEEARPPEPDGAKQNHPAPVSKAPRQAAVLNDDPSQRDFGWKQSIVLLL
jgi:hypothetical protein